MKIVIGCDNAAVELKNCIKNYLEETRGIVFEDIGINDASDNTIYPKVARKAVDIVNNNENDIEYGILICGTGIGMALAANKFKGIRAAVCHDVFSAERAKKSNNTNFITMGARVIGPELAKKIIDVWIDSKYSGGRSTPKVETIDEYEQLNFR